MFQSLIIYGGLLFVMILLGIHAAYAQINSLNQNQSFWRIDIVFSMLLFAIISGLRYDVGVDYLSYLDSYNSLKLNMDINENFESGFNWIMIQFALLDAHPALMFGFIAMIQIFFIFFAFKDERYLYPALSFVILTGGIYFTMMNEIRQSIVWAIFIYAVRFTEKDKLLHYLVLTFIGFLFHRSALFLMPMFLFLVFNRNYFYSVWMQLLLFLFAIILSENNIWSYLMLQVENVIELIGYGERYGNVMSSIEIWEKDYIKGVRYYGMVSVNLLIILYSDKLKHFYPQKVFKKYYNLYFIGILLDSLFYYNTLFQRPARYFTCFQFVLTAYFIYYLWVNRRMKFSNVIILITVILIHLVVLIAYVNSDHHTVYKFFWQI